MLFVGDDCAKAHHDVEIETDEGRVVARRRLPEGSAGITMLHELIAEHLDPAAEPDQVLIGIIADEQHHTTPHVDRHVEPRRRPATT